jgi:hypothetical protein
MKDAAGLREGHNLCYEMGVGIQCHKKLQTILAEWLDLKNIVTRHDIPTKRVS